MPGVFECAGNGCGEDDQACRHQTKQNAERDLAWRPNLSQFADGLASDKQQSRVTEPSAMITGKKEPQRKLQRVNTDGCLS